MKYIILFLLAAQGLGAQTILIDADTSYFDFETGQFIQEKEIDWPKPEAEALLLIREYKEWCETQQFIYMNWTDETYGVIQRPVTFVRKPTLEDFEAWLKEKDMENGGTIWLD